MDGQIISSILKQNNKYQNDKIAEMQKRYREYRDFLDTWVHEIKTPITSARLIVENEKNPVTLKIDDELRKIDHYVELVLYYARSSDVEKTSKWKNYFERTCQHGIKELFKNTDTSRRTY